MPGRIMRTAKPKQPREYREYIARPSSGAGEGHAVPPGDLPFEFMLNALRLHDGFTKGCFESRTGLSVDTFEGPMRESMQRGLIDTTVDGWKPTELGSRFLNDLQSAFLK
jgi:oxygen-independent coproporphyrinogen-3 oxidase